MTYGLEIKNSSGKIVLSNGYNTPRVVSSGYSYGYYDSLYQEWTNSVPAVTGDQTVYVKCLNATSYILGRVEELEVGTFVLRTTAQLNFHYLVVAPSVQDPQGYGLRLTDSTGNTIFNSNAIQFVISTAVFGQAIESASGNVFICSSTYNPANDYHTIFPAKGAYTLIDYGWSQQYEGGIFYPYVSVSASSISVYYFLGWTDGGTYFPPTEGRYLTASILTGYPL